jgi:hypothetical protein
MSLNPDHIRKQLAELRQLDVDRNLFGAKIHGYELQPTISEADITHYEKQQGITIPEEYRYFVTEVGNGGAGPFYGISGVPAQYGLDDLAAPFAYTKYTQEKSGSNLRQQINELDESDEDFDEKYEELTLKYWAENNANGALHICDYGCGLRFFLVLNGTERNHIWFDACADFDGFSPVYIPTTGFSTEWCHQNQDTDQRVSFAQWYEAWLDWAIRSVS